MRRLCERPATLWLPRFLAHSDDPSGWCNVKQLPLTVFCRHLWERAAHKEWNLCQVKCKWGLARRFAETSQTDPNLWFSWDRALGISKSIFSILYSPCDCESVGFNYSPRTWGAGGAQQQDKLKPTEPTICAEMQIICWHTHSLEYCKFWIISKFQTPEKL